MQEVEKEKGRRLVALFLLKAGIFSGHECLEFVLLFLCDGWLHLVVVIVLEEHWEHLLRRVAFRTTEGVGAGKDILGNELVEEMVTLAVAAQDSSCLPELDVIQELMTGDSYLAYENLIVIVGG